MATEASHIDEHWYARAFDALYPVVYAHRTVAAAAPEFAFAREATQLGRDEALLDLCCGMGRHLVHALTWTRRASGLDFSAVLLEHAQRNTAGRVHLVRGDMRHLPFATRFDVVMNFFTSYGYFRAQAENEAVLAGIARVLRPGGRFFVDYLNAEQVQASLVPRSEREVNGLQVCEERWLEAGDPPRVNKRTRIAQDGKEVSCSEESVALVPAPAFCDSLRAHGLIPDQVYGDYDGQGHGAGSPRTIVVGRRA